jgi:hypothetical protein
MHLGLEALIHGPTAMSWVAREITKSKWLSMMMTNTHPAQDNTWQGDRQVAQPSDKLPQIPTPLVL